MDVWVSRQPAGQQPFSPNALKSWKPVTPGFAFVTYDTYKDARAFGVEFAWAFFGESS